MVTNLTQEAKAKWAEAIATKDPEKKLKLLREFYSVMPKHKSTEKLEMSIKRQIVNLQEEVERRKSKKTGSSLQMWSVKKEDMLQLALVGRLQPTVRFFNKLTGLDINTYNALMKPAMGVFKALNIRMQIILTPVDEKIGEEKLDKIISIARNADAVIIYVDNTDYIEKIISWFNERNIDITTRRLKAEIEQTPHGGIRIVGRSEKIGEREAFEFVKSFGIKNAVIKFSNDAVMDDLEDAIFGRIAKRSVFVSENVPIPRLPAVQLENFEKEAFMENIIKKIGLIRVFTKKIGGEPVNEPLLLDENSRITDLAERIHKDFARKFKFARLWRNNTLIRAGRSFTLEDLDVVELHAD